MREVRAAVRATTTVVARATLRKVAARATTTAAGATTPRVHGSF